MPYVEGDRSDCQLSTTTIALNLRLRAIELASGWQSDLSPSTRGMIFIMSLLRDMKLMSNDKSVDLTGVLSCRATLFECLRHSLLSLLQVSSMWRHKPDLLLFRSIAGTGNLLSKHALGILWTLFHVSCTTFDFNKKQIGHYFSVGRNLCATG